MKWLKKNWYYPILALFVGGFLWFGVTSSTPTDKSMGYLGALFFFLMLLSARLLAYMSDREVANCLSLETVKIGGRSVDCFRFSYATANLRVLLFMCIAALPMLLAVCYATSFGNVKGDILLAIIPFGIIGLTVAVLKRPGLRMTADGLLIRGRLKSSRNEFHAQDLFVPWDEIAEVDPTFVILSIATGNGHGVKYKQVPGAFIGIQLRDYRSIAASDKVKETLRLSRETFGFDVLMPAATLQKEQDIQSHYYFVASPPAILQVLRYYLGPTSPRADIGTRMGYTNINSMLGPALRANVKDQTTGELAKIYREKSQVGAAGRS